MEAQGIVTQVEHVPEDEGALCYIKVELGKGEEGSTRGVGVGVVGVVEKVSA
jgi:hypothetical protein